MAGDFLFLGKLSKEQFKEFEEFLDKAAGGPNDIESLKRATTGQISRVTSALSSLERSAALLGLSVDKWDEKYDENRKVPQMITADQEPAFFMANLMEAFKYPVRGAQDMIFKIRKMRDLKWTLTSRLDLLDFVAKNQGTWRSTLNSLFVEATVDAGGRSRYPSLTGE